MQALLNIELDDKSGKYLTVDERFNVVMLRVRNFFSRAVGEVRTAQYETHNGEIAGTITESTAVITVDFHTEKNLFEMALNTIAKEFNQDCIAVLYSDGEGKLVGPKANEWPEFTTDYFVVPSIYELLAA